MAKVLCQVNYGKNIMTNETEPYIEQKKYF